MSIQVLILVVAFFGMDFKELNCRLPPPPFQYQDTRQCIVMYSFLTFCGQASKAGPWRQTHEYLLVQKLHFWYKLKSVAVNSSTPSSVRGKGWKKKKNKNGLSIVTDKSPKRKLERRKRIRSIFKCTTPPFIMFLIPFSLLLFVLLCCCLSLACTFSRLYNASS